MYGIYGPYGALPAPGQSPPMWLASVGEDVKKRMARIYYPHGDPIEMAQSMQFAKQHGLAVNPYLAQAARIRGIWYGAPSVPKSIFFGAFMGVGFLVFGLLIVKGVKKFSAPRSSDEKFTDPELAKVVNNIRKCLGYSEGKVKFWCGSGSCFVTINDNTNLAGSLEEKALARAGIDRTEIRSKYKIQRYGQSPQGTYDNLVKYWKYIETKVCPRARSLFASGDYKEAGWYKEIRSW